MQLEWKTAGVNESQIAAVCSKVLPQLKPLKREYLNFNYSTPFSCVALSFETKFLKQSNHLAAKFKNVELVIVIGIGGSNLGAQAVFEAIKGKHNNLFSKRKVIWLDAIDADTLTAAKKAIAKTPLSKTLVIVISKSGSTTESIANFQTVYKKGANVVVISEKNSSLHNLATASGFHFLEIPRNISGRYSVFSNVGLFPLAVMGIDVAELLTGARKSFSQCFSTNWKQNPALILAVLLYIHHKRGKHLHESFFFANNLESLGKWWRQLLAESTGKEKNLQGKKVNEGITPLIAIPVDLHSQAQLYFGGKNDRFYSVIGVAKQFSYTIPFVKGTAAIVPEIQGKASAQVLTAISTGFKKTLAAYRRPFVEINLEKINEEEIGTYMQVHMTAVILLAGLLKVNAFDQPNVQDYKNETVKQLKKATKGK